MPCAQIGCFQPELRRRDASGPIQTELIVIWKSDAVHPPDILCLTPHPRIDLLYEIAIANGVAARGKSHRQHLSRDVPDISVFSVASAHGIPAHVAAISRAAAPILCVGSANCVLSDAKAA